MSHNDLMKVQLNAMFCYTILTSRWTRNSCESNSSLNVFCLARTASSVIHFKCEKGQKERRERCTNEGKV